MADVRVEVIRSPRRRRTVQARQVGDVLRISIPAAMSAAEEAHWVEEMTRRLGRRAAAGEIDLERRAGTLAARYRLPKPASVRWVSNQSARWGSCTPSDGTVRLSDRLASFPGWVLDYVLVHELAHLVVADHGPHFHQLVARYPKAERAVGFLIAKGMTGDDPVPVESPAEQAALALGWDSDEPDVTPTWPPGRRARPGGGRRRQG